MGSEPEINGDFNGIACLTARFAAGEQSMVAGPNGRSDCLTPHGNPFAKPGVAASITAEAESFFRQ
jgi:hypothetical protein